MTRTLPAKSLFTLVGSMRYSRFQYKREEVDSLFVHFGNSTDSILQWHFTTALWFCHRKFSRGFPMLAIWTFSPNKKIYTHTNSDSDTHLNCNASNGCWMSAELMHLSSANTGASSHRNTMFIAPLHCVTQILAGATMMPQKIIGMNTRPILTLR